VRPQYYFLPRLISSMIFEVAGSPMTATCQ
jgi:hypothetical protein